MKKLLSIILIIAVVLSLCTTVFANYQLYDIAGIQEESLLFIEGNIATCISRVISFSTDVESIQLTQSLEKQGFLWIWSKYAGEWTKTLTQSGNLYCKVYFLPKGNYRVKTVFTFTMKNGATQTFTLYSAEESVS